MSKALLLLSCSLPLLACSSGNANECGQRIQAETADVLGRASFSKELSGYSGSGYVELPGGPEDGVAFVITRPDTAKEATLQIRYATAPWSGLTMGPNGPVKNTFALALDFGGNVQEQVNLVPSAEWALQDVPLQLGAGRNLIRMTASGENAGHIQLDYLSFVTQN